MNRSSLGPLFLGFSTLLASCAGTPTGESPVCGISNHYDAGSPLNSEVASAETGPPLILGGVGTEAIIAAWGSPLDPGMVTFGPTEGVNQASDPYETKTGTDVIFPERMSPVLAPLDMKFVGFTNRSAIARGEKTPFDDLELCFESEDEHWPGMKICVYHLYTSPLLTLHSEDSETCGFQKEFGDRTQAGGMIYFETNDADYCADSAAVSECGALLGRSVNRGSVIGYAGQVGSTDEFLPFAPFRFKVRNDQLNPMVTEGDPYLHWVQASTFFYWREAGTEGATSPGVLTFPRDFNATVPESQKNPSLKFD